MKSTSQHSGMPQFERDHIETLFFQKLDQTRVVELDHDQIRVDAEQIHIDPRTADRLRHIVRIVI